MGADFKEKAKDTFKKCWDRAGVEAHTPDLFAKRIGGKSFCVEGDLSAAGSVKVDDDVILRRRGGAVSAFRGNSEVATIREPSPDLLTAMSHGCDVAEAKVRSVDPASGVGEFEIIK